MQTPKQTPERDAPTPEAGASARHLGARQSSARRRLATWVILGTGAGAAAALLVLGLVSMVRFDAPPTLTPERYYEAKAQWQAAAPPNYDIEVEITGPQSAHYLVKVRRGEPTAAERNGVPIKQRRVYGTWSVPGMFGTMSRDVEAIERRAAGKAAADEQQLVLRAEFDLVYGYPARYERIEWGSARGSTSAAAMWKVTRFELVDP
jgi:hypothetical protein